MAKDWITLTVAHLKSAMTSKEVTSFSTAVTDGDPDERATPILADLTQEIRGFIASCTQNTLSADETKIPSEFKSKALDIARWRLLTSVAGYQPGEARKTAFETANTFFRDVAKCVYRPEEATDAVKPAVPEQATTPSPRIVSRGRRFTRDTQDGV